MAVDSESVLFAGTGSKVGLETEAEFLTVAETFDASVTVRVIDELVPLLSAVLRMQLTFCPEAEQVQPALPETKVKPVGKVSVTVMGALAFCSPAAFATVSV